MPAGNIFPSLPRDLQEPPEIILEFLELMRSDKADVVFGVRAKRADPLLGRLASNTFWTLYRALVNPEIPRGGVDRFRSRQSARCATRSAP